MAGLRLAESTVERTNEVAERRLGDHLAGGRTLGPARLWGWGRDAAGRTVAYL